HDQVGLVQRGGSPHERSGDPRRHQQQRGVRPDLGAYPGDLARPQTREPARAKPPALLGHPALAIKLRGPLAQPIAAVRALGEVRAHLRAAALANHEEVRTTRAHNPIVERENGAQMAYTVAATISAITS